MTFRLKSKEQVDGQLMPAGLLDTCPEPLTVTATVADGVAPPAETSTSAPAATASAKLGLSTARA